MAMDFIFKPLFDLICKPKATPPKTPSMRLMTSQLPAFYMSENNDYYHLLYLARLKGLGFSKQDAQKMFKYECDIIRKHNKKHLLNPDYIDQWIFSLLKPHFSDYPKTKDDILKEDYLTISELCKTIDEAQWHFYNSHERNLPEGVWEEIYEWHVKGPGADFAMKYFDMISVKLYIPMENLMAYSNDQGDHLNRFRWR